MRSAVWLLLAVGFGNAAIAGPVSLHALRWHAVADSLRMDFEFAGGRPARYRVQASPDTASSRTLVLEFDGARAPDRPLEKTPRWAHVVAGPDIESFAIRIDLDGQTPWKAAWDGDTLRVGILDRVRSGGVWRNPWAIGGLGTAFLAGSLALWLSGTERNRSSSGDGVIPPPDIAFPR
jgi:hypothetical protein